MGRRRESSRQRFEKYREEIREQGPSTVGGSPHDSRPHDPKKRRLRTARQLITAFIDITRGQRSGIVVALATLTVATLLALIPPAATKFVVDYVLTERPLPAAWTDHLPRPDDRWQLLWWITGGVILVSFVKVFFHLWGRWYATRTTKRIQFAIRKRAFEHAIRLPLHRVQELKSGGIASVLRQDAGSVGDLVFGMFYNPWRAIIQLLGSLCILAWVDWRLLIGAVALLPLVWVTHRTWISRIRPRFRDIRARRELVDAQATETFGGMRVVRAFSRQTNESVRFMTESHLMGRQELMVWWWSRLIEVVWETLIPIASAGVLLYGGWQVLEGRLTLGDLMMFLVYLLMLLEPLAVLAQSSAQFQNSLSGLDRVLDLLAEPREMESAGDSKLVHREHVVGRVTFEDVSFRYPQSSESGRAAEFALEQINLEAEPGKTVALVGPSGAGKTTLCNLVARFYDPSGGRILLDGQDVAELDVESYRRLLGVVEQDVFLFDGTVAANIGYADRNAEESDIRRAAELANADGFIRELPDAYDTIIGERGVKLSGGQRQRIAIARAILADPKILILDEATSNLDTESERLIQGSLDNLMRDRTCFVIAHRLSTIAHADTILVIENGRIIESGSHTDLMASDGRYRDMVLLQIGVPTEPATVDDAV